MSVCQGCGAELAPNRGPGHPRKWCSERCRKEQYAGTCVDCGGPTNGYDGPGRAHERCAACRHAYQHETRYWTPEAIIAAIKASAKETGRAPTAREWLYACPEGAPTVHTVQRVFGSWNVAIAAAGFTPRAPGERSVSGYHYRKATATA